VDAGLFPNQRPIKNRLGIKIDVIGPPKDPAVFILFIDGQLKQEMDSPFLVFDLVGRNATLKRGTTCFWKPRRDSVRMLCSCARTGTQPFSRIPLRMEEVGRKLYLSETPSIGWEAKTLGAKRRISSSEIATVPGTVNLVELLFNAVLMLVDLVSWL
jgi:hypothetical protein